MILILWTVELSYVIFSILIKTVQRFWCVWPFHSIFRFFLIIIGWSQYSFLTLYIAGFLNLSVWTQLRMFYNSKLSRNMFKCCRGRGLGLHFSLLSMNRLNQTELFLFILEELIDRNIIYKTKQIFGIIYAICASSLLVLIPSGILSCEQAYGTSVVLLSAQSCLN